jgi:hypothetical protein|tara:strand:- start:633 stop:1031 length:399 start_codon:yes stop_codon:yes gene_type:complete
MITPLIILEKKFSQEILDIIQSYLTNNIVNEALVYYFDYLYNKNELYDDFITREYIQPNCKCIKYWSNNRYKFSECNTCCDYEYSNKYIPMNFRICIWDNPQYNKITRGDNINYEMYNKNFDYSMNKPFYFF